VRLDDGSAVTLRSETTVDVERQRTTSRQRYERRWPDGRIEREDEVRSLTWYDEEQIKSLLHMAGFATSRVCDSPRTGDAAPDVRCFAVIAET
jgi:hypothetical protein